MPCMYIRYVLGMTGGEDGGVLGAEAPAQAQARGGGRETLNPKPEPPNPKS